MSFAKSKFQRLFLIRHGDTDWTESRQHTGRTDLALNANGIARAQKLGAQIAGSSSGFAKVFTSPLIRASRTCELAGFGGVAEKDADLVEWDYGAYEGLKTVDIQKDHPGWSLFRDGAPKGESVADVAARADRFVAKVRTVDGDVAAFSSGHTIRMIAARWLGLEPHSAEMFFTATASVGILGYEHDLTEPCILLWNDNRPA